MNHPRPDLLDLYLDGELAAAERATVEAHLAACPACRDELAALRNLAGRVAALPPEPLPVDLAPLVLRRIVPARATARFRVGVALLVAQAVAIVALASWYLVQPPTLDVASSDWSWLVDPIGLELGWLAQFAPGPPVAVDVTMGWDALPLAQVLTDAGAPALLAAMAIWLVGNGLLLRDPAAETGERGSA